MSIRESLERVPPAVGIAVVAVIVVGVGIYAYSQFASGTSAPVAEAGATTTLACSQCNHTVERDTAELQKQSTDPFGRIELSSEAAKCPQCGQSALEVVRSNGQ